MKTKTLLSILSKQEFENLGRTWPGEKLDRVGELYGPFVVGRVRVLIEVIAQDEARCYFESPAGDADFNYALKDFIEAEMGFWKGPK